MAKSEKIWLAIMFVVWVILAILVSNLGVAHSAEATVSKKKKAPTTLVIIACRIDDFTGKRPLPEGVIPSPKWRDTEWHLDKGNELECKRETMQLEDSALYSKMADKGLVPLDPDFADHFQCSRTGMIMSPQWEEHNKGWGVMAVGCPTPIAQDADADGKPDLDKDGNAIILDYKLPDCPSSIAGKPIKCRFDGSAI